MLLKKNINSEKNNCSLLPYTSGRFAELRGAFRTPPEASLNCGEPSVHLRKVRRTVGKPPYTSGRSAGLWGSIRTSPEGSLDSGEASVHLRKVRWTLGKHPYTDHKNTRSRKPEASESGLSMLVMARLKVALSLDIVVL